MTSETVTIEGTVLQGYQVASGLGADDRFPGGSLAMQVPFFKERGLDLSPFYRGTLNIDIAPVQAHLEKPDFFFENIDWTDIHGPENFMFVTAVAEFGGQRYEGYIYYPDPATKPSDIHAHNYARLEFIGPKIDGMAYGETIKLHIRADAFSFDRFNQKERAGA